MIDPFVQVTVVGCTHGTDDIIDVSKMEYNLQTKEWWVSTEENLKVPHRFPYVVVMGKGKGPTLEEAMERAVADHISKREQIKKENSLT